MLRALLWCCPVVRVVRALLRVWEIVCVTCWTPCLALSVPKGRDTHIPHERTDTPGGTTTTDPEHPMLSPLGRTKIPDVQGVLRTEPAT